MSRLCLPAVIFALGIVVSLSAAEPISRARLAKPQTTRFKTPQLAPQHYYDLYVAEPVPDVMYRLEFRYLETSFQEASEWATYSVTDDFETIEDGILWIALHLVAEWRVTEFEPSPDWQLVGTYSTQAAASNNADFWQDLGYLTRVEHRYDGGRISTEQLELQLQIGF